MARVRHFAEARLCGLFSTSVSARTDALVVYVTAPEAEAPGLARALVERRVAACVNVVPGVRSFYWWDGKVADDAEVLLIAKTTSERLEALRSAVVELHSYDVPEVIALPISAGHPPYLGWIGDSVQEPGR